MAKKKYYQGKKDRMDESKGMKHAAGFGVSEGDNGLPPEQVIVRRSSGGYDGANIYYEQGAGYQEKEMMKAEKGVKSQKLDGHF